MKKVEFKNMWEAMQNDGYFSNHPHYSDYFGKQLTAEDKELDGQVLALDFSSSEIYMPVPYSEALERSVKRTESTWLPQMFKLPESGVALDVGCGFGRSVTWLSEKYDQVIGTDISSQVIEIAEKVCENYGNVQFYTNEADALPPEIMPDSVDVAYVFTVFQHIPREFTVGLLRQIRSVLRDHGVVVFNLISNVNEAQNSGKPETEWAIGYSEQQAKDLVEQAGLHLQKINRWSGPESSVSWLWVAAGKDPDNHDKN